MPTYDYQCQKCGFEFERVQRITEDPIKTCPECKSRKAKRLLSAPNFILKGGGWYADGYGSGNGKASKSTGSDGDDSGGGGAKPEKSASSGDKGGKGDKGGEAKAGKKDTGSSTSARKSAA